MITKDSIPDGWMWTSVGRSFAFTSKPRNLDVDAHPAVPFIPMDLIPIHRLQASDHVLKAPADLTSGTYFENGDLLVSKITPCFENGKQAIITGLPLPFGYATTEVIPLKAIDGVSDLRFLFYYLMEPSVRAELAGRMEGATGRQRLSKSTLEAWEMALPPLDEQRTIVESLTLILDEIAVQDKTIATLNELKSAVMADLIPRAADVAQEPDGWTTANFDDCIDDLPTRLKSIPKSLFKTTGKYPIIDQGQDYIGGYTDDELSVYQSGLPVIVFGDHTRALKYVDRSFAAGADGTKIFRAGSSLDPLFLFYALVRLEIPSRGYNRHYPLLREQKILYPVDKVAQRGIATTIRGVDLRIEIAEHKLSQFNALFQSSLRELMSGSLRTTPLLAG